MTAFRARSRELEVGERLGPYRLDELLGKGGMGLVFRAVHEPDGHVVALKVLLQALCADETFTRRFAHEARASAQVSHPNLVPILGAGELDGRQYLAMAYVPGPTLESRIRAHARLELDETLALAAELGAALDALHSRGIVHRDVKPSNVLFEEDGRALLTDFGLAKGHGYTALTAPGQVFGTLHYVAPELIRGEPATPATDLYALGCVVYEAATGTPPFAAADAVDIGVGHLRREPPDPRTHGIDVPPALSDALLRALAKDPGRRPASGADYARGLRAARDAAPEREPAAAHAGLAGYRIVRKLGQGTGGSVWEGRHLRLGHRAALKILEAPGDEEHRERFVLESRLVAAIDHPNIIPIYDSGDEAGVLYIAMRYVDGGDLAELIRAAGPLEPTRALGILEQVAAALDAVHARGLVHRDVKPANVLIDDPGGRAFLGDFGTAYRPRPRTADTPRFTGTLGYAAPEQLDGKAAGPRADVYALGCVLFECLTARRPFERDNDVAVLYAHLLDPPPRVAGLRPELPPALDGVFGRALAKTADGRFATCGELIVAARAALGVAAGGSEARGPAQPPPRSEQPAAPAARLALPATRLVGRERELEALQRLLSDGRTRMVTLTGPGGCGKTRLAVEAAHAVQERFRDGVIVVTLDAVSDPALVPRAIADALTLEERATPDAGALLRGLERRLEHAELLLVLDGFERVLPAAPLVAGLLAATTGLKLLVTSQASLHLHGEHELPVAPLDLDAAVRLFVDRARSVHAGFTLAGDDAAAVAEICRRLDGLPLAVELAAARTKLLSPLAIIARLENRLELLTGGARDLPARHHTLRGAIDWTHGLLEADEQAVFACLAAFEGGLTPDDGEAVCGPTSHSPPLDVLASLVDKSLLMRRERPSGEPRLEMLQTIREYARYHLIERGELDDVRRRHAERYLAVAEAAEESLLGPRQAAVVQRLEEETGNVRAALTWSLESGRLELGLRMAGALARFWSIRDQMTEGRAWLRQALARSGSVAPAVRARGLFAAAYCALGQGDYVDAATRFEQSLETYRMLQDRRGEATCLAQIAWLLVARGQLEQATAAAMRALDLARALDDRATASVALADLAEIALRTGDRDRATQLFGEVLVMRRALGDRRNIANALVNLGRAELLAGDPTGAGARLESGLALAREVADTWGTSLAQISLARLALDRRDVAGAGALAALALSSCRARGDRRTAAECLSLIALLAAQCGRPDDAGRLRSAAARLRAAMGAPPNAMECGLEAGAVAGASAEPLAFEQAVELALAVARSTTVQATREPS